MKENKASNGISENISFVNLLKNKNWYQSGTGIGYSKNKLILKTTTCNRPFYWPKVVHLTVFHPKFNALGRAREDENMFWRAPPLGDDI